MTTEELAVARYKEQQVAIARRVGAQGGKARARVLSPEQRRALAKKAARARWAKAKKSR